MKLNIQLFASTTISATMSGDSAYTQRLIVEETATDVQNNTSDVSWSLTLTSTKALQYGSYNYTGNDTYSVSINGNVISSGGYKYDFRNYHTLTIASGTVTGIQHNADGTKTIDLSSYVGMTHVSKGSGTATGTLVLTDLHRPPSNVRYTITETNSLLTSAGISNNLFVENLSVKQINVTGDLHDSATVDRVGVYNRITAYSNTANPITLNLKNITLQKNDAGTKIPLVGYIKDSFNTQGLSSSLDNPDLYDFITYRNIGITEPQTYAKRYGQLSGQVKLTISGTYFNGTIGNKNQSGSYKPTIKYKFWKLGDTEPSTYANTVDPANITISNGTFTVSGLNIGSTTTSASNYFNPSYSYRVKVQVNDNFTTYTSVEKVITKGEPVWSEYKDRVNFQKITIKGKELLTPNPHSSNTSYTTNYIQLGYINCSLLINTDWTNLTLLISNSFYGVQHWSTYILTLAQAQTVKANITKLGGNNRNFYYKVDTTNSRIYIYAKCTGGNGFGYWNTFVLNNMECEWVQQITPNVSYDSSWVEIYKTLADVPVVLYDNNTGIQSKHSALIDNLASYKKLAITFTVYKNSDQANTGGTAHICWLDLTKKDTNNYARSGIVVPYSSQHLVDGNIQSNDFKALFEANLNNNRVYCLFGYNGSVQTSDGYVMTKIEGYYN